jgi:hypothetical protein
MPWPERIFRGQYPSATNRAQRVPIPPAYATEIQTVIHTLNDLRQPKAAWQCGTEGLGVLVSDSLMFQRGDPHPGDPHLGHVYGLALPALKRGIPIQPVQLENTVIPGYLRNLRCLLLSYQGQKPLTPDVHAALADWVRHGGILVIVDDDRDPFCQVREWWNTHGQSWPTPRHHLLQQLGIPTTAAPGLYPVGRGRVAWHAENPASLASDSEGDTRLIGWIQAATQGRLRWRETDHLVLQRGPYTIAAGLDESLDTPPRILRGRFISLFDPTLALRHEVVLSPGTRWFLVDLDRVPRTDGHLVAAAAKVLPSDRARRVSAYTVEGIANTPALVLLRARKPPAAVELDGAPLPNVRHDPQERLLWVPFTNTAAPRNLTLRW